MQFLEDLPKSARESNTERDLQNNERYKIICSYMKDPEHPGAVILSPLTKMGATVDTFLETFAGKREELLIYILCDQLSVQ